MSKGETELLTPEQAKYLDAFCKRLRCTPKGWECIIPDAEAEILDPTPQIEQK